MVENLPGSGGSVVQSGGSAAGAACIQTSVEQRGVTTWGENASVELMRGREGGGGDRRPGEGGTRRTADGEGAPSSASSGTMQ